MSYRKVYLEWTIGEDSLQPNVPVGFEVDFSRDKHFHEITTTFTTFETFDPTGAYRFEYSLDNGNTWTQYPWGDQGKIFNSPFRMRLAITPSDLGYTLSFSNGSIKKISADSKQVINSSTLDFEEVQDVDQFEDVIYLVTNDTLYKIDGRTLEPYDNSLPLLADTVGVVVDESRGTLWQVNRTTLWLRSLYGDILWSQPIPEIDVNPSSSSSTSSSSESSEHVVSSSSSITESQSSSSESSESVGNTSSSSSSESSESSNSSSSSSESSLGEPSMYATGFDAFPQLRGVYYAVSSLDGYYIYHNDNGCILQHDTYGVTRWKLYLNETNRAMARDHYYKDTETTDPYDGGSNNYGIHMWWDTSSIPPTGITGTISDTP